MRDLPPVRVCLRRFVAWRAAVLLLATLAAASVAAWLVLTPLAESAWVRAAAACCLAAVAGSALWLWSGPATPADLQWDGTSWRLLTARTSDARHRKAGGAASEAIDSTPPVGALAVMIDLDSWLLLRFIGQAADGRRVVRWLPAERSALGADWHALRCAVHAASQRPAAATGARAPRG